VNITDRKVDFVVAGAQKAGTTALDYYLRQHPEIGMAGCKEVHFFDNDEHFHNSPPPYDVYHAAFQGSASRKIWGEVTPIYMYWREAPRRLWEYNPSLKIVIVLRNPIERAYSAWNMERDRNADPLPFWDAIQSERKRRREATPHQQRHYSYVDRGFYTKQLRRIWKYFPREQTLVLRHENLRADPLATLAALCDFVGVDPFEKVEPVTAHSCPYVRSISSPEREYLRELFFREIKKIERLFGWDCSNWMDDAVPDVPGAQARDAFQSAGCAGS
jgi:hypothetical protein